MQDGLARAVPQPLHLDHPGSFASRGLDWKLLTRVKSTWRRLKPAFFRFYLDLLGQGELVWA